MKHKHILSLILCILTFSGYAQGPSLQELVNKKQFAAVIAQAGRLTAADSADYATMSAIGQAYEGMIRYKDAFRYYTHCLSLDTSNVDASNAVARMAMSLGKGTIAKDCFLKTLQTDSTDFYANYQLARLYFQQGEYENAVHRFRILCDQDTTFVNPTLYSNMGDCFLKMNSPSSAIICYFTAYDVNRENIGLANSLFNLLLRAGGANILDAIQVCDSALYYNPGNQLMMKNKALALYQNREFEQADTLFTTLLAEGDTSFITYKYGGGARYMAGQPMNAVELLEKAYQIDSTDIEVNLLLGASLGKTYDRKRAFKLFDQAELLMQPEEALTNLLLISRSETLRKDGRPHESDAMLYSAWLKNKHRLDYLFRIEREYPNWGPNYRSDEERQRALFIKNLFLNECLQTGRKLTGFHIYRPFLEYMLEDAFFRNTKEITVIAPNGKKSKLSMTDLQTLLSRLPEVPESEKIIQGQINAALKKQQEKKSNDQEADSTSNAELKKILENNTRDRQKEQMNE